MIRRPRSVIRPTLVAFSGALALAGVLAVGGLAAGAGTTATAVPALEPTAPPTPPPTPQPDVTNTARPTIVGTPVVGTAVTATPGTWTPVETSAAYQWLVAGEPVTDATTSSYTPVVTDLGKTLEVRVTATKTQFDDGTATSAASTIGPGALMAIAKPKVTGKAKKRATLKVSPGTWSPTGTVTYQWYAGTKAIPKATRTKLKLTGKTLKAVAGKKISVRLTVAAPGYTTVTTRLKIPGKI